MKKIIIQIIGMIGGVVLSGGSVWVAFYLDHLYIPEHAEGVWYHFPAFLTVFAIGVGGTIGGIALFVYSGSCLEKAWNRRTP